jgi:hypothetical protein
MHPMVIGVVVGDVVFIVLVLLACLFIVGVGISAVYSLARAGRCDGCHRWTVRESGSGPVLCRSCLAATVRSETARGERAEASHDAVVHELLQRHLPRHHEAETHGETAP